MSWAVTPPAIPSVAIEGTGARFPVRRIFCVGRNYAAHAREMGDDPTREPPFFFTKPADAVLDAGRGRGATLTYPRATEALEHEIELAVALGSGGADLTQDQALACVYGYAVSLDLTRRDLQRVAKDKRRPWDMAKGFDQSAPVGPLHRASLIGHPRAGRIWVEVAGELRQEADLADLIWSVPELIAHLSVLVELSAGDLILTGTPAGVGPIEPGQRVVGGVDGLGELVLDVLPRV